jgi:hypothetical protein
MVKLYKIEQKAEFDIAQFGKTYEKVKGETKVALAKSGVQTGTGSAYNIALESKLAQNNFITDFIKVSETINTDEVMSVNKDVANKYLKDQSNNLINKYKSLATNNNVGIKFENYALAETQKTIFRTDTQISKNILKNLFNGYDKQKELLLITADTDESGMAKATLKSDLEKLTKDTFTSQVSAPELKIMLDSIPAEIDLMDGNKDVIQQPRKTFYSLKDKNYLPNLSFEQRQKLKEKAITIIRPQITTEWENYTASVMAGKEPPAFDMKLATEIMTKPVADKMLQEESIIKDTVINNNLILTSPAKDLNELYKNIIDESYESNTELKGQALETHYQTILKKREDGLNKDPVNFIIQTNNSEIANLVSELENLKGTSVGAGPVFDSSAEALAISQKNIELASALASEQTKLGIPESQHRFMTNEQATGFVNSYIALAEKGDQQGMQTLMLSLGNDYGVYESKVIAQLKTSGLPEGAEIALSLGNSELAVEALALDTKQEKDSLKDFLKRSTDNEIKFDDIKIMISEEMKDFEAILRKNVPLDSSGTLPEIDKLMEFLTYAAINRMYGKDMNAENAAESAANTFMQNFHLEDTYFIPKIYDGQDISASVDGIIDKANVLKDYYLPEFNAVAFKSATERDEALLTNKMKSQMQTNGQWRNTPDGEGLVFGIVLANGSFAPVVNEKGEELAFKFNDTTYTIPGTSENFDINLKYNEDLENVYAMGGAIKVDLEPVAVKDKTFNEESFSKYIKTVENDKLISGNVKAFRHKSPEGGLDTVGFGHKLTAEEQKTNTVYSYDLSTITKDNVLEISNDILRQDLEKAEKILINVHGDKFNNLDNRRKQMLIDMQFNVRNFKNKNVFPLFKKALFAGDEEGMKKEYKRFFKSNGKTKSLARNEFFKKYFLDK